MSHSKLIEWCDQNWYALSNGLPDWWDRYNDWIPSVTAVLWLIIDKQFEIVKLMHAEAVAQACINWTKQHKDLEDLMNGNTKMSSVGARVYEYLIYKSYKVISTETRLVKKINWLLLQWTIDLIIEDSSLVRKNFDYKNSKIISKKYLLQMWWYNLLNWNKWIVFPLKGKNKVYHSNQEHKDLFFMLLEYFYKLKNGFF